MWVFNSRDIRMAQRSTSYGHRCVCAVRRGAGGGQAAVRSGTDVSCLAALPIPVADLNIVVNVCSDESWGWILKALQPLGHILTLLSQSLSLKHAPTTATSVALCSKSLFHQHAAWFSRTYRTLASHGCGTHASLSRDSMPSAQPRLFDLA